MLIISVFSLNRTIDFTASHHTDNLIKLPIELNKDTMKVNQQVIFSLRIWSQVTSHIKIQSIHTLWKTIEVSDPVLVDAGYLWGRKWGQQVRWHSPSSCTHRDRNTFHSQCVSESQQWRYSTCLKKLSQNQWIWLYLSQTLNGDFKQSFPCACFPSKNIQFYVTLGNLLENKKWLS